MTVVISYTADRPSSFVETSPKERKQFCNNDFEEHLFYNQDVFCDGFFLFGLESYYFVEIILIILEVNGNQFLNIYFYIIH